MPTPNNTTVNSGPRAIEGDIDGPKFFSRSALRSGYLFVGIIGCLGAVVYDASILYRRWQSLSTNDAFLLIVAGAYLLMLLLQVLADRARMYDIYSGALPPEQPRGMSIDGLLDLAARALIRPLFETSFLVFLLLFLIDTHLVRGH